MNKQNFKKRFKTPNKIFMIVSAFLCSFQLESSVFSLQNRDDIKDFLWAIKKARADWNEGLSCQKALFNLQLLLVCFRAFCSSWPPVFHKYFFIPTIYWVLNIILKSVNERSGKKNWLSINRLCLFPEKSLWQGRTTTKKSLLKNHNLK